MKINRKKLKKRRQIRIRAKIKGTKDRPRLAVFRSQKHIYAQLIDDEEGRVLVSASDLNLKLKDKKKSDLAKEVGNSLAQKAIAKGIKKIVFDRRGYKYHGRIKSLAEASKEGGLNF